MIELDREVEETPIEQNNEYKCEICLKEFSIVKSFFITQFQECIICNQKVCSDCHSESKRFANDTGKTGYACKNCFDKTKTNLTAPFLDLNGVHNIIEKGFPIMLDQLNSTINTNMLEIKHELVNILNSNILNARNFLRDFIQENKLLIILISLIPSFITIQVLLVIKLFYILFS